MHPGRGERKSQKVSFAGPGPVGRHKATRLFMLHHDSVLSTSLHWQGPTLADRRYYHTYPRLFMIRKSESMRGL
jgi:hypothetical protein